MGLTWEELRRQRVRVATGDGGVTAALAFQRLTACYEQAQAREVARTPLPGDREQLSLFGAAGEALASSPTLTDLPRLILRENLLVLEPTPLAHFSALFRLHWGALEWYRQRRRPLRTFDGFADGCRLARPEEDRPHEP
jgi:hypothetical protein